MRCVANRAALHRRLCGVRRPCLNVDQRPALDRLAGDALQSRVRSFCGLYSSLSMQVCSPTATPVVYVERSGTRRGNLHPRSVQAARHELRASGFRFEVRRTSGATNATPGMCDQVALFDKACVVISGHGQQLTNALFAPPGSTLLEVTPVGGSGGLFCAMLHGFPVHYRPLTTGVVFEPNVSYAAGTWPFSDMRIDAEVLVRLAEEARSHSPQSTTVGAGRCSV